MLNTFLKVIRGLMNRAIEQSSNRAIEQSSNRAIEQSSNRAIEQSSNRAIEHSPSFLKLSHYLSLSLLVDRPASIKPRLLERYLISNIFRAKHCLGGND